MRQQKEGVPGMSNAIAGGGSFELPRHPAGATPSFYAKRRKEGE